MPEYNYISIFAYKLLRAIRIYVLYRRFTGKVTHLKNYHIYVTSCFHRNRYRCRYRSAVFFQLNGTEDGIISIVINFTSTISICTMPIQAMPIFVKVFWRMFLIKVWKYNRIFNETILNMEYVYFSIPREKIIRCLIIDDNRRSVQRSMFIHTNIEVATATFIWTADNTRGNNRIVIRLRSISIYYNALWKIHLTFSYFLRALRSTID